MDVHRGAGQGSSPHLAQSPGSWLNGGVGLGLTHNRRAHVVQRRQLLRAGLDEGLGPSLVPQHKLELRNVHPQEQLGLLRARLLSLHDLRQHLRAQAAASAAALAFWRARRVILFDSKLGALML